MKKMKNKRLIYHYDMSRHNEACLDVINETMVGNYSLIKGDSSYKIDKRFLFNTKIKELMIDIQLSINDYVTNLELKPTLLSSSWFNILYKGGVVEKHQHADSWDNKESSVVSGAYYPYVEENSCPLLFGDGSIKESFNGLLIIFPSWLEHWTTPNQSSKRITVSFNTIRKDVYLERSK
jgi:hypothetical protein